jgi:hypothetical protein
MCVCVCVYKFGCTKLIHHVNVYTKFTKSYLPNTFRIFRTIVSCVDAILFELLDSFKDTKTPKPLHFKSMKKNQFPWTSKLRFIPYRNS